jgi:competence ComEA-like helix-hairpin-helix protein
MANDWTNGAAKWCAVLVLAGASFAAATWSLVGRESNRQLEVRRQALPVPVAASPPTRVEADAVRETETEAVQIDAGEVSLAERDSPPEADAPESAPIWLPKPILTRTVNINTATAAELELLPGIGPAMAARILEHRTQIGRFTSIDQLDDVRGIGPKTLEKLRPLVRTE